MYSLIHHTSNASAAESDRGKKSRTGRAERVVPAFVFQVEAFEAAVVRLSRRGKVDLTRRMRRATARDFKIQLDKLETEVCLPRSAVTRSSAGG